MHNHFDHNQTLVRKSSWRPIRETASRCGRLLKIEAPHELGEDYVDALSSDAEFIGSDGHRYATPTVATPVPEPSVLVLMIGGLACIGMLVRRRRP